MNCGEIMKDTESLKLYCKRKNRLCYLADVDGNCVSTNYPESEENMCTADWINWNNVHSCETMLEAHTKNNTNSLLDCSLTYSITPEEEFEEQRKVSLAENYLESLGIKVRTDMYGYYRHTYDILFDLGEYLDKKKEYNSSLLTACKKYLSEE